METNTHRSDLKKLNCKYDDQGRKNTNRNNKLVILHLKPNSYEKTKAKRNNDIKTLLHLNLFFYFKNLSICCLVPCTFT